MLIEKFEEQVKNTPGNIAIKSRDQTLTYLELNRKVNLIARLIGAGIGGEIVGLLFDHGVNMVAAILAALKAGKIYVPLSVDYPLQRLVYMLSDSEASLIVTDTANGALAQKLGKDRNIPVVDIETCNRDPLVAVENPSRSIPGEKAAYIMYTSGSTGRPKGVIQNHQNVLYFTRNWGRIFSIAPSDRIILHASFCHDISVQDIFTALLSGAVLLPYDIKKQEKTGELKEFIQEERITIWHSVPTLFRYFIKILTDSEGFESLRFIQLGGEPVHAHDVDMIRKHFPHAGPAIIYGQTESSVNSVLLIQEGERYNRPLLGTPLPGTRLMVVDDEGTPVKPLRSGEILAASHHISPGYWKKTDATEEVFQNHPKLGRLYWTGDMGRLLIDGNIQFIGRKDNQVKIRGFRIEPGEIESWLLKHQYIDEVVVKVVETKDEIEDKALCAYIVCNHPGVIDKSIENLSAMLKVYLSELVPDYMIPPYFIRLERFPLTPGGKVDRKALPLPEIGEIDRKTFVAPHTRVEIKLQEIWRDVLISPGIIGIEDNFFQLGGHSLRAIMLASRIQKVLNVNVPLTEIFKRPTIHGLSEYINAAKKERYASIEAVEKREYLALSPAQKRLYILQCMEIANVSYNMPQVVPFPGTIDIHGMQSVFNQLIRRHESLRTSFEIVNEEPVQRIHHEVAFEIELFDITNRHPQSPPPEEITKFFLRPFDLSTAPLLRAGIIKEENGMHILLVDIHHIITDGTSNRILIDEFNTLYLGKGEELSPLRLQYKDYAYWQNSEMQRALIEEQETYWLNMFAREVPVLNLPTDYPRPGTRDFQGSRVDFILSEKESSALKVLAKETGATLYISILSVFTLLLSRFSGQEDIVVGTPVAARRHADLEKIIGMFVNTLALRNHVPADASVREFVTELKSRTLKAFENQEYQFESLVEKINVERDIAHNPVFDVMFNLLNMEDYNDNFSIIPGEDSDRSPHHTPYTHKEGTSKFDLTLNAAEFDEQVHLSFEYCTRLFKPTTIERYISSFKKISRELSANPDQNLSKIEIITPDERYRVLYEFINTGTDYPAEKTLHELFAGQVEQSSDRTAIVGPLEMKDRTYMTNKTYISYRELNEKSDRLAYLLIEKGIPKDSIVGIMAGPSIEMLIGLWGILKAGCAYLPIDPEYPRERIEYMLADSDARLLVVTGSLAEEAEKNFKIPVFDFPSLLFSLPSTSALTSTCRVSSANPAYVIYTSGSTGKPRGVIIENKPVVNFIKGITDVITFSENDRIFSLTTLSFDIFVLETILPLIKGSSVFIGSKEHRMNFEAAASVIEGEKITIFQTTPSRLQLFIYESGVSQSLSKLKHLLVGGEVFPMELLKKAREIITGEIYNLYGPTETTIWSTIKNVSHSESLNIGKPIANTRVYILDKNGYIQPLGVPGELCIAGAGMARGYLNHPELTARKFDRDLWKNHQGNHRSNQSNRSYILYKTGDLARWLPDGDIEFLGRMDYQVKIRGFRIELGEIENQLLTHGKIKEAIVIARENNNDKYLCAYLVVKPGEANPIDQTGLREYLSNRLPDYMVPAYFVQLDKIPMTPNGKVNRKALPAPKMRTRKTYTAPGNEIEKKLLDIWSETLNVEKEKIGMEDNFFNLGGHSLKAMVLTSRIHKGLNVEIPLTVLFKTPYIRGLATYIKETVVSNYHPVEPMEKKVYYSLSSAQRRLYILQQMDEQGRGYNMPSVWQLEGDYEKEKFETVIHELIRRHGSLRTYFTMVNDKPVQRIHEDTVIGHWSLVIGKAEESEIEDIIKNFIKPFDLSRAPLLRVRLIELLHSSSAPGGHPRRVTYNSQEGKENRYLLMVDMHHIISDGLSTGILVKEFMELYAGKTLPRLRLQYKDYGEWQNCQVRREFLLEQQTYWKKQFAGEVPVLGLPADYPRPALQDFVGHNIHFEINREETAAVKSLARELDVTLFMLLLSLYTVFLSKLSSQEDIVVGSPTAARRHSDLEGIIGMFVNTLALRNFPVPGKPFNRFLAEIKENTIKAFENQDYLYEDLVEQVEVQRDTGRNPLFDTMFALQNMETPAIQIPGLKLTPYLYERQTAKFDLTLTAVEIEDCLAFTFEYCTKLFKQETIHRFIGYFRKTISTVLGNHDIRILGLEIIGTEEKKRILHEFNETAADYPKDKTIPRLFAEQVERTPDRIALAGSPMREYRTYMTHMTYISYRQLNEKTHRLACYLIEKGVTTDTIVAIMIERSLEMIIGIIGILKAGGAYLPIDPAYPEERKEYMLKDSKSALLLTASTIAEAMNRSYKTHMSYISPGSLAYVIYTSGSTGKPKGTLIQHRSLVNRLNWMQRFYPLGKDDVILQKTTYTFDVSVWELLWWGIVGARVYLLKPGDEKDPGAIAAEIRRQCITTIHFVPSMLNSFLDYISENNIGVLYCKTLRRVFSSGEALSADRVEQFNRWLYKKNNTDLINLYGPTEATIDVSYFNCTGIEADGEAIKTIPIGKPIENTCLYILDRNMGLQPVGLEGELFIGGIGLARGYLNKPELTAETFVEHTSYTSYMSYLYKTGDLARWLSDGNIEFLGRMDHQVKVRGFRIELGEIENQLLTHGKIKEAIVIARENNNDKYLCAYLVAKPGETKRIDHTGLREYLSNRLPDYMVPAYFVQLDNIPLTPNGKIDRKALPDQVFTGGPEYTAPGNKLERELVDIWAEVLGRDQMQVSQLRQSISIDNNFFQLGGHSLKATILTARIHKKFDIQIPLAEFFKTPTIKQLASYMQRIGRDRFVSIEPVEKKEYYALSSAQKRLYILHQFEKNSKAYNMPLILTLEGNITAGNMEEIFKKLISRHESLRTWFGKINEEPVQGILSDVEFEIEYLNISQDESDFDVKEESSNGIGNSQLEAIIIDLFVRPFDLARAPLIRVGLRKIGKYKHILMIDMHHIITDGLSYNILLRDFTLLYAGQKLPPLMLQYKEYSRWQQGREIQDTIKKQEGYWLKEFQENIPVLNLPADYPRPPVKSFEGDRIGFALSAEEISRLYEIAHTENTTLFMLILAAFNIFLAKLSSREDIVVGIPIAGRRHTDLETIVGVFINTLAVRSFPAGEKTFKQFLKEIKEKTIKSFENQDYQLEDLVEKAAVKRDRSRNPLFDVTFSHQNFLDVTAPDGKTGEIRDLKIKPYGYENRTSKFDLNLRVFEVEEKLSFSFEYSTKLFTKATILRFIHYFKKIISTEIVFTDTKISQMEIMPEQERNRVALEEMGKIKDAEVKYSPPTTAMEKKIAAAWTEVLKLEADKISIYDDFFERGGNSLTVINLTSRLREIGCAISLVEVMSNLTIKDLAAIIDERMISTDLKEKIYEERLLSQLDCIEKLNNGRGGKNIFIFHPRHGMVNQYKELAQLLEKKYNVYGVHARAWNSAWKIPGNTSQVVNDYLEQVLALQKNGPYIIAGFCAGTIIGYEIVRKLERMGHQVEKLILFDSHCFLPDKYIKFLRISGYLPNFVKKLYLSSRDRNLKRAIRAEKLFKNDKNDGGEITIEIDDDLRREKISKYMDLLYFRISPLELIKAPILVPLVENTDRWRATEENFDKMTRNKATVVETTGQHNTIWEKPYVNKLAEIILNYV